jgi:hypothetical protein
MNSLEEIFLALTNRLRQQALSNLLSLHDPAVFKTLTQSGAFAAAEPTSDSKLFKEFEYSKVMEHAQSQAYRVFSIYFREGILIIHTPRGEQEDALIDFLSRRDHVIRTLMRQQLPVMTSLAVLVADVQNSVRICSELPSDEYFELINQIWHTMSQVLRKNWLTELKLNIGLHEGQEWVGAFQSDHHIEFMVLGDTINFAARLSDFAKNGSVWATKNLISRLSAQERKSIEFGVLRRSHESGDRFVESSYAQIDSLVAFEQQNNYRSKSFFTIPMKTLEGEMIGAMQLINATDPDTGEIIAFSTTAQEIVAIRLTALISKKFQAINHLPLTTMALSNRCR